MSKSSEKNFTVNLKNSCKKDLWMENGSMQKENNKLNFSTYLRRVKYFEKIFK